MFHLFGKIYLDFDEKISMSQNRIIVSQENGGIDVYEDLAVVFYGKILASVKSVSELFGEGAPYESFADLLNAAKTCSDSDTRPVYIYCDHDSYYYLASQWLKMILPNCSAADAWKFFKSYMFKEKNFINSRMSATQRFAGGISESWQLEEAKFLTYYDYDPLPAGDSWNTLMDSIRSKLSIEFLLASYLYDERYASELAVCMSPLVRKDLEKILYEHKEILIVHFQKPIFQQLLEVQNGPYDFDNFYDMANDPAPMVEVLCRTNVWGNAKTSIYAASSSGTINLSNFTLEDIETLKRYSAITGTAGVDEPRQSVVYTEVNKFDFIPFFKDSDIISVEDMKKIIQYELNHQTHAAGSFYAFDLGSVNTYFVDYILKNHQNKEMLFKYTLA